MYEATIAMTVCKAGMAGKYTFEFRPSCLRDGNVGDHGPALSPKLVFIGLMLPRGRPQARGNSIRPYTHAARHF